MIWYKNLKKKFRSGNLLSRILRTVFEKHAIRPLVGLQLFAGVLFLGPLPGLVDQPDVLSFPTVGTTETVVATANEVVVTKSEFAMQNPTAEFISVSTYFRAGHPGYDIRAPLGSDLYPIQEGRVKAIVHSTHGFGRHVILEHANGIESLYAHMGQIAVDEGQSVTLQTKLGEVGLTGWTTGPHLHLEIYRDGVAVNPGNYIDLDNLPMKNVAMSSTTTEAVTASAAVLVPAISQ